MRSEGTDSRGSGLSPEEISDLLREAEGSLGGPAAAGSGEQPGEPSNVAPPAAQVGPAGGAGPADPTDSAGTADPVAEPGATPAGPVAESGADDAAVAGADHAVTPAANPTADVQPVPGQAGKRQQLAEGEADALGEVGNIAMGAAATALGSLLKRRVAITTPRVQVTTLEEVLGEGPQLFVTVQVQFTRGLEGTNVFVMRPNDAGIIGDLMMGGNGTWRGGTLDEVYLSAVAEAMNQMMGSAATAMSTMFNRRVDISPPHTQLWQSNESSRLPPELLPGGEVVCVAFSLEIEGLVNSDFYQFLPLKMAHHMIEALMAGAAASAQELAEAYAPAAGIPPGLDEAAAAAAPAVPVPQVALPATAADGAQSSPNSSQEVPTMAHDPRLATGAGWQAQPAEVRPVQFSQLSSRAVSDAPQNLQLLLDVPLQVTVELGRTRMKIKDVLDLGKGSIIELDKLAGEPIDVLVNGKLIAKGEVVVIDESFGIKITDIVSPAERMQGLQ